MLEPPAKLQHSWVWGSPPGMPATPMHSPHQLLGTVPQPLGQAVAGGGQEELAVHGAELPLHVGHCLQQPEPGDTDGAEFSAWVPSAAGTAMLSPRWESSLPP